MEEINKDIADIKEKVIPLIKKHGGFVVGGFLIPGNPKSMIGFGGLHGNGAQALIICIQSLQLTPLDAIAVLVEALRNEGSYKVEVQVNESLDGGKLSPYTGSK